MRNTGKSRNGFWIFVFFVATAVCFGLLIKEWGNQNIINLLLTLFSAGMGFFIARKREREILISQGEFMEPALEKKDLKKIPEQFIQEEERYKKIFNNKPEQINKMEEKMDEDQTDETPDFSGDDDEESSDEEDSGSFEEDE